nr:protein stabilized1 [Tanacetum cinerariifolium]
QGLNLDGIRPQKVEPLMNNDPSCLCTSPLTMAELGVLSSRIGIKGWANGFNVGSRTENRERVWMKSAIVERELETVKKGDCLMKKKESTEPRTMAAVRAESKQRSKKEADYLLQRRYRNAPNSGILWAALIEIAPRPHKKKKPLLLTCGTKHQHKEVLRKCVTAKPKFGEKWQAISKAVENSHQPIEAILKKYVVALVQRRDKHLFSNNFNYVAYIMPIGTLAILDCVPDV